MAWWVRMALLMAPKDLGAVVELEDRQEHHTN